MKLTKAQLDRLTILKKECTDVIKLTEHIIIYGYDGQKFDGHSVFENNTLLEMEIADVSLVF